jgi:glutamyl-Q tRNA(Asp) synthetase
MRFVTRFAPSPTGRLHRGHAYSALTAFDATRCRPEYEAGIYEDLAWLGLDWEQPVRRQSDHLAEYRTALDTLRDRGLAYRCFRTRREILDEIGRAPHGPGEVFRGAPLPADEEAALVAEGRPYAWRLSLDAAREHLGADWARLSFHDADAGVVQARPETAGDIVLARKDVGVAYHLAVVHDDALQGVTQVIRGQDLFEATHIQRLLQALLGLPTPTYRHHALLTDAQGRRFAKRDRAETLQDIRARGVSAETLRRELFQAADETPKRPA